MRVLKNILFTVLVLSLNPLHADVWPTGQGLPLPWPFPWAKECPVDWNAMAGRYMLSDTSSPQFIDLKITVISHVGFKLVRIARYNSAGNLESDGFTFVNEKQRMLHISLEPTAVAAHPIWATIKLHYQSNVWSCTADHLIPILTLEAEGGGDRPATQYKLLKIDSSKN